MVAPNQPQSMYDLSYIKMMKKFQEYSWSNLNTVVIIIMHLLSNVRDGRLTDFPRESIRIKIYSRTVEVLNTNILLPKCDAIVNRIGSFVAALLFKGGQRIYKTIHTENYITLINAG